MNEGWSKVREGTVTEQLGIQHHRAAAIQQLGLCPSVAVMGELVPPGLVCPQPGQHACQKKILRQEMDQQQETADFP